MEHGTHEQEECPACGKTLKWQHRRGWVCVNPLCTDNEDTW